MPGLQKLESEAPLVVNFCAVLKQELTNDLPVPRDKLVRAIDNFIPPTDVVKQSSKKINQ